MDSQIKKRRLHSITCLPCIGKSPRGQNIYDPPVTFLAYIAKKHTMVRNRVGEEVTSSTQLYFDGVLAFGMSDVIQFDGRDYPIITVSPFDGLRPGTGTTVVYV